MSALVNVPDSFNGPLIAAFVAASGTNAKILADISPSSGTPGTAGFRSGGQRLFDLLASSADNASNSIAIWEGVQTTLYANMGAATTTASGNATVTRSAGSFLTDGYTPGDTVMLFGAVAGTNNGVPLTVSSVATSTLTFSGVPAGFTANTEGASLRLLRVHRRATIPISGGAGYLSGALNAQLIGGSYDKTLDTLGIELGPLGMLIVAPISAVGSNAVLSINGKTALR